jgi:hypothetical protein
VKRRSPSPETREKIRQASIRRWQNPEFRARHLPLFMAVRAAGAKMGSAVAAAKRQVRPPKGTLAYRQYTKIARELGAAAARSLQFKSAETEGAGRP